MKLRALTRMAGSVTARPGDVIDVPTDVGDVMVKKGFACSVDAPEEEPDEPDTELDDEPQQSRLQEATWRDTPVDKLEIDEGLKAGLKDAHLETAGDVADYDRQHSGLTPLRGFGKVGQKQVRAAIVALKESASE